MRFFKLWVGLAMVAALVLGITLGNFVVAGGNFLPGSTDDPLVSESYITQAVEEKTAALEYQIFELEKQVTSLTNTVAALESQLGRTSTSASGQTSQTSQSSQSSQTSQTSQPSQTNQTGQTSQTSQTNQTNQTGSSTTPSSNTGQTSSTIKKMVISAASGVNVRNGPSTSYDIIASLSNGTIIDVISESSGWYEIVVEGTTTGWVHGDFVE